jgi:hypothetical protein
VPLGLQLARLTKAGSMQKIIEGILNAYINYLPDDWSLLTFFHNT